MIRLAMILVLIAFVPLAGCSPADDAATAPELDAAAAGAAPVAEMDPPDEKVEETVESPEVETEPEVAMPEGLPAIVHIYPELTVTEATAVDPDVNRFVITGETSLSVVGVLNYYAEYFRENGWEEDMLMEQTGNTVISYRKDGILQYVESTEGGPGAFVTITVGNY